MHHRHVRPRGVHERVDAPELRDDVGEERGRGRFVFEGQLPRLGLAAVRLDLGDDLVGRREVAGVRDRDVAAAFCE